MAGEADTLTAREHVAALLIPGLLMASTIAGKAMAPGQAIASALAVADALLKETRGPGIEVAHVLPDLVRPA